MNLSPHGFEQSLAFRHASSEIYSALLSAADRAAAGADAAAWVLDEDVQSPSASPDTASPRRSSFPAIDHAVAARRRREAAASAVSTPPPRSRSRRGETSPRDVVLADAFRRWRESPPSPSHPLALSCLARAAAARQPRSTLRRAVRVWRERCFAAARARRSAARRARSAALRRALGQWRRRARWQAGWQRRWRCRADRCGGERCVHLPCMRTLELRAVFLEGGNAAVGDAYRRRRILSVVLCAWWRVAANVR
ncbi:hypothetical protein EMIHUDRAFT_445790 [Emiliania huxleyi CCMP1516]|uniref:Uncharacterized protein n=2 Tax=Emiliania huxleyi TaxID=2903 RepID=A0A0D3IR49_EMIH1|nr:hypothetical protein EMIHUDRAFT_445790 [Emiliania huxleyi CCMP1516]EOD13734.1 hypothetical protein EMIHUDRAFT_445790 [Emiliania huxleyi CCMP1516]|eukprot:XP_005766163.1 hypothetical protein EMIHUDRAFT_445790 [Emiliania huxleyi CCMP1516]